MGLFDRSPAPPAWAQPMFDRKGWGVFRAELERTVTRLDPAASIDDALGHIDLTVDGLGARVPMKDLATMCAGDDPAPVLADWAAQLSARAAATRPPDSYDEARPLLRIQLYGDTTHPPLAIEAGPGLWFAGVIDTPVAMLPVRQPLLDRWQMRIDDVLEDAFVNMDELPHPSFDGTHTPIMVAHGDEYLTAVAWARIGELIGDTPHGALVTFPTRESMLFLPLWEMPSDVALRRMVLATDKLFAGSESSVSRELYWCTPDLELVVTSPVRADGAMMFLLPPGLDDLMQAATKS